MVQQTPLTNGASSEIDDDELLEDEKQPHQHQHQQQHHEDEEKKDEREERELYSYAPDASWSKQLESAIQLRHERSQAFQHVDKSQQQQQEQNVILEPFAQQCMHLYSGEWTVLSCSDNFEKSPVAALERGQQEYDEQQQKRLFAAQTPNFEIFTKRTMHHPHHFNENQQTNFLVKCHSLSMEHGVFEPLFCSIELVNVAKKQRISERFHFHLNGYDILNDFLDDLFRKKELLKFQKEEYPPKAIFTITHDVTPIEDDTSLNDIYAILWIDKIYSAQPISTVLKNYISSPTSSAAKMSEMEKQCAGLKNYLQPFLFAFIPLFETKPVDSLPASLHSISTSSSNLAVEPTKRSRLSIRIQSALSNAASAPVAQTKMRLREGLLAFKQFYPSAILQEESSDLFDLIHNSGQRDGTFTKTKSKLKPVAGYCIVELLSFDANKVETDTAERIFLFKSDPRITPINFPNAQDAITAIEKQMKEWRKTSIGLANSASNDDSRDEKIHLKYHLLELSHLQPKVPYFSFMHYLFVFPEFLDLTKARCPTEPKLKPRNLLIEVTFMEKEGSSAAQLVPHYERHSLVQTMQCGLWNDLKNPKFADQIKIVLPLPVKPTNHLLFNIYHLHTEKRKPATTPKKTLFAHAVLPLKDIIESWTRSKEVGPCFHNIALLKNLPENYLDRTNEPDLILTKNIFHCKSILMSTIYPQDQSLSGFFHECSPFLNAVDPNLKRNVKYVSNAVKSATGALKDLTRKPLLKVLSHYPLVMDMLFSIMCRSPDLLSSFVNKQQDESRPISVSNNKSSFGSESSLDISASPSPSNASSGLQAVNMRMQNRRASVKVVSDQNRRASINQNAAAEDRRRSNNNRASKNYSLLASGEQSSALPVAKENDFDLKKYLETKAAEEEKKQTPQPTTSDELKKRRRSIFNLFKKDEPPTSPLTSASAQGAQQPAASQPVKHNSFHKTPSLSNSDNSNNDIAAFLDVSSALFDLQRESLLALMSMVKGAAQLKNDNSRNNSILSSYVQYVFKDVIMTTSPVCFVIAEMISELISKADESLRVACAPCDSQEDKGSKKRSQGENTSTNSNDYNSRLMSISEGKGVPAYYDLLQFMWFFFDIIMKSLLLNVESLHDKGFKIFGAMKELVRAVAEKVRINRDNIRDLQTSVALNQQTALFLRDLFDAPMKPSYTFELIEVYLSEIRKERVKSTSILKIMADFAAILSDHPSFIALNHETHQIKDLVSISQPLCKPPISLIDTLIKESLISFRTDNELQSSVVHTIRYILTKLDHDARYQETTKRQYIARMFIPYVVMLFDQFSYVQQLELVYRKEHMRCVMYILSNSDPKEPMFQKYFLQNKNAMLLLAVCTEDVFKSFHRSEKAFFDGKIRSLSNIFEIVTHQNKQYLRDVVIPQLDPTKFYSSLTDVLKNTYTCTMLDFAFHIMIGLLLRVNEQRIQIPTSLLETTKWYLQNLKDHFKHHSTSPYWRWFYGCILTFMELPLKNEVFAGPEVRMLMEELESPLNVISLNDLQPLEILPDSNDNILLEAGEDSMDVRAATLEKLVERITLVTGQGTYLQTFFISYRSFCSPQELMLKLASNFLKMKQLSEVSQDANKAAQDSKVTQDAKMGIIRLLNSIKHWINDHFYDFDNSLVVTITHFIDRFLSGEFMSASGPLKKRIEQALLYGIQTAGHTSTTHNLSISNTSTVQQFRRSYENISDLMECGALEVARQITLIEHDIFRKITPKECFKNNWNKKDKEKNSPHIVMLTSRFNNMSAWVATHIMKGETPRDRAKIMKFFVDVAEKCKELANFNAMFAIVSALNLASIHRLQKTKVLLSKKTESRLAQLCDLISTAGSYKGLREAVAKIVPPCIPYIGVYLTDLTFLEDGNPDMVKVKPELNDTQQDDNNDAASEGKTLINYSKRRKIAKVIMDIRMWQTSMYDFSPIPPLQVCLEKLQPRYSEDELYSNSLRWEPREK